MPAPTRCITTRDVRRFVDEQIFSAPPGPLEGRGGAASRVGVELEWVARPRGGAAACAPDALRAAIGTLPNRSRVTFEPGGQLELSGPALPGLGAAVRAMTADVAAARGAVGACGVELVGIGLDPTGLRDRVVDADRYRAMEAYFDTRWPDGRTMMRNTASVQVNLDLGSAAEVDVRWRRAHDLLPVLAAAFANSPFDATGAATGWRSTRLAVWSRIDPRRTRPAARTQAGAATAWTTYALDAPVMLFRVGDRCVPSVRPVTFARWIHDGHELGWPTLDDFAYHLTTLFPPVRPRGWFELRIVDALPDEWWPVAVAVTTALLDDPEAADVAARVGSTRSSGGWIGAAQTALSDPAIAVAADRCFAAAIAALGRLGADDATVAATESYYERYVARGRCPADDLNPDPSRVTVG
jgi:glutamate--cysteine ligase